MIKIMESEEGSGVLHSVSPLDSRARSRVKMLRDGKGGPQTPPSSSNEQWTLLERYLPCHYFDYMAGTSPGGLISIMLGRLSIQWTSASKRTRYCQRGSSGIHAGSIAEVSDFSTQETIMIRRSGERSSAMLLDSATLMGGLAPSCSSSMRICAGYKRTEDTIYPC